MSYYFKDFTYNAWIHWNVTSVCNYNCEHCFGHIDMTHEVDPIKIPELLSTLKNTGRIFRISFTGGEPFLVPNIIEASQAITEEHYISLNTNLIHEKVKTFAESVDPSRVVRVHASFHFEELKDHGEIHRYIGNYQLLEERGFPMYAEAVGFPKLAPLAEEIRHYLMEHDIILRYGPYFGTFENRKYPEGYSNKELTQFGLSEDCRLLHRQMGAFCNAGYNTIVATHTGKILPCFHFNETLGNLYEEIKFNNSIKVCPHKQCGCPLNVYDERLFLDALREIRLI
jgi:MoaA/NifB/PqqE/SkfB family radical SAM enzyme